MSATRGNREAGVVTRRPGRPRSEQADHAIIDAALDLFAESGPEGVCIEAVAARAGVGKTTIYRRWPGKEDLLVDALDALKGPLPEPAGKSVRDDLIALLRVMCESWTDPRAARAFGLILGEGDRYPRLVERYVREVLEPRREVFRQVLRRGMQAGELRPDADVEVALHMITGAVTSRGRHNPAPLPADYPERVADSALRGLAAR
jgi:AcrR family transcriptional regulator